MSINRPLLDDEQPEPIVKPQEEQADSVSEYPDEPFEYPLIYD